MPYTIKKSNSNMHKDKMLRLRLRRRNTAGHTIKKRATQKGGVSRCNTNVGIMVLCKNPLKFVVVEESIYQNVTLGSVGNATVTYYEIEGNFTYDNIDINKYCNYLNNIKTKKSILILYNDNNKAEKERVKVNLPENQFMVAHSSGKNGYFVFINLGRESLISPKITMKYVSDISQYKDVTLTEDEVKGLVMLEPYTESVYGVPKGTPVPLQSYENVTLPHAASTTYEHPLTAAAPAPTYEKMTLGVNTEQEYAEQEYADLGTVNNPATPTNHPTHASQPANLYEFPAPQPPATPAQQPPASPAPPVSPAQPTYTHMTTSPAPPASLPPASLPPAQQTPASRPSAPLPSANVQKPQKTASTSQQPPAGQANFCDNISNKMECLTKFAIPYDLYHNKAKIYIKKQLKQNNKKYDKASSYWLVLYKDRLQIRSGNEGMPIIKNFSNDGLENHLDEFFPHDNEFIYVLTNRDYTRETPATVTDVTRVFVKDIKKAFTKKIGGGSTIKSTRKRTRHTKPARHTLKRR